MNYTKKCQCEHTDYTITRWTIQFDYKYKIECTCGSFIQWATQEDVALYNERYNKSMKFEKGTEWLGRKPSRFSAIERRRKLFVTYGDLGEQIYRPAVKLSR